MTRVTWRKSSYSGQSGSCVEVRVAPTGIGVRDTKNRGHTLNFSNNTWASFITAIKMRDVGA